MKDNSICKKCVSGQKNGIGKKCQACIENNMFEEKGASATKLKRIKLNQDKE